MTHPPADDQEIEGGGQTFVTLGHVSGVHGVQGWLKVHSDTQPRERIVTYSPWYLERDGVRARHKVKAGRRQGKGVVAKLEGCNDRDAAEALIGSMIVIEREQLPQIDEPGSFYWADLVGLRVETIDGDDLGRIEQLFETGSNDVMVLAGERERLVPYIWQQVVKQVDLDAGVMRVDWDPEF
jgi:16S rRNA processing protein RimM